MAQLLSCALGFYVLGVLILIIIVIVVSGVSGALQRKVRVPCSKFQRTGIYEPKLNMSSPIEKVTVRVEREDLQMCAKGGVWVYDSLKGVKSV